MSVAILTQRGIRRVQQDQENPEELISSKKAAEMLEKLWDQPFSVDAFRQLRHRRREDPEMPKPAFVDGDIILWRRGDLYKIKKPSRHNPRPGRRKKHQGES